MKSLRSSPTRKTNRLFQIILCSFLLIGFRIWHLAIIQGEEKILEAEKPRRRTVMQRATRGMIVDRFGTPLATNRICYHASIHYSQFSSIPAVIWKSGPNDARVRTTPRKDHIRALSQVMGLELGQDPLRIEDLIHSKASLFPHVPYIIHHDITEQQYYRLKSLEREWPGLCVESTVERFYPLGRTASGILGHLGAISQEEYLAHAGELDFLQNLLMDGLGDESTQEKVKELKERAYTLNDLVGKAGIEKQYESLLRGYFGKKIFEIDHKGSCVRELPGGKDPVPGQTVVLSLSAELQKFCEELLIKAEVSREGRSLGTDQETRERVSLKQPWIKGGAIVALDPSSGEVLALASTPRFDPNDYVLKTANREIKNRNIHRWQESQQLIADLWDGKETLLRERPGKEEKASVTWEFFLHEILPERGGLRAWFHRTEELKAAIQLQEDFEALLYLTQCPDPEKIFEIPADSFSPETLLIKKRVEQALSSIPASRDKIFALDLLRMAVYAPAFTDELITKLGSLTLSKHRQLTHSFQRLENLLCKTCKTLFHSSQFSSWREANQKDFLRQKRLEEKERKTFARPYLDYLDSKERELFDEFWQSIRLPLLSALLKEEISSLPQPLHAYYDLCSSFKNEEDYEALRQAALSLTSDESLQWFKTMRSFRELTRPLWSSSRLIRGKKGEQMECDLAASFYPKAGFGFSRSYAFQSAAPLGSLFKLITAYEALRQNGNSLSFTINDEIRFDEKKQLIVATTSDRKPLYRHYKGGRLPRSHLPHLGKVDLAGALEQSSNPYFSLLASDFLSDPEDLAHAAAEFGLGERTGIDLPAESKGRLPDDLKKNRTGLYSFAIGQHTLLSTPLQAASFLGALANGGLLLTPSLTNSSTLKRTISLPSAIRSALFDGMELALWGPKGSARPSVIRGLHGNPALLRDFLSLQHQMIGKTSTSEVLCHSECNPTALPHMYKHIWFGAIAFGSELRDRRSRPELAVVVFLRFGDGGKECAPLAAQVIKKWREIRDRPRAPLQIE